MIWIFALGVLGFAIFHQGFRKVCFWIGGIAIAGILCIVIVTKAQDDQRQRQQAEEIAQRR